MTRPIPDRESLTVEFKSDARRLPDTDLVLAVVCLANTEGGDVYLGVEDDGRITGLHQDHLNLIGLSALVSNRTSPPLSVRVTPLTVDGLSIARLEVPKSTRLVATTDGTMQRRWLMADGRPECKPFLPHEFATRRADLGLLDYSSLPVRGTTMDDFDPIERIRLRQLIEKYHGDRALLELSDSALDGALGLVRRDDALSVPTVTGLLLLGREEALRRHLPTHEVAFQVLDELEVRVNDFYRTPLLKTFERVLEQFSARVDEEELNVGLFRVPVPSIDRHAFREALVNALTHRDYTRLGAVHVQWTREALSVSSPGGFPEGVRPDNLLVVDPTPRNPVLADAFKRIGLAERTGRGVDIIYKGLLQMGRPAPDYNRSDRTRVVLRLSSEKADLPFVRWLLEEEQRLGAPLSLDALIALGLLREARRLEVQEIATAIQKDVNAARTALEKLAEAGMVEAHGVKKGRTYTLSAKVYRALGQPSEFVRQAGFDPLQQEQMVLKYVQAHGRIKRAEVMGLCRIGEFQASRLLHRLTKQGALNLEGTGKGAYYTSGGGR